jgi:hypothetical protein
MLGQGHCQRGMYVDQIQNKNNCDEWFVCLFVWKRIKTNSDFNYLCKMKKCCVFKYCVNYELM